MSTLGVPNIVKCSGCRLLLEETRLASGNSTYARKRWDCGLSAAGSRSSHGRSGKKR